MKTTIESDKFYALAELAHMRAIPWLRQYKSYRRILEADRGKKNILKVMIRGEGRGTKYVIKGENVKKLIKALESGYKL